MGEANILKALRGLNTAEVTKNGVYLEEGDYTIKIKNCTFLNTFDKGDAFIAEMEILTSDNPNHPPGSERSWYQSFKFQKTAFSELKKFLYAVYGLDMTNVEHKKAIESQIDPNADTIVDKACKENYLAGRTCKLEVVTRASKKSVDAKTGEPKEFSNYIFTPLPVQKAVAAA